MPDSVPRLNEEHRYFPEWADRPEIPGRLFEADHNSPALPASTRGRRAEHARGRLAPP